MGSVDPLGTRTPNYQPNKNTNKQPPPNKINNTIVLNQNIEPTAGIEPATFSLQGKRSSQLSYVGLF